MATVAVVGGGISGLTAAYYLNTLGKSVIKNVVFLEKSSQFGGWIKSTRFDDGTVHEQGPRSIRPIGPGGIATLQLVDDLGLSSKVIPVRLGEPSTRNRFILVNGRLHPLPIGFSALFKSSPPFKKPLSFAVFKDLFTPKKEVDDESMYDFALRRLGKDIADYAIDPLCRGVVAGNCKEISVFTILKPLFEAEQKHGSIVKGMLKSIAKPSAKKVISESNLVKLAKEEKWRMWNLTNGLQSLPESLLSEIKKSGTQIYSNSGCEKIIFNADKKVELHFSGNIKSVDHVFACLPACNLNKIVSGHPALTNLLSQIKSVSVGLVNLEYNSDFIAHQGFGFLVPSNQDSKILGVVYDSCCFPEHNGRTKPQKSRLTVMMGGHWFEELFGDPTRADSDYLLKTAIAAMREYLGVNELPIRQQVFILQNCIPQYLVGHRKKVIDLRDCITKLNLPISLVGASYDGVSVNDCVYNAKNCVQNYINELNKETITV